MQIRHVRTTPELEQELHAQVSSMRASCAMWDGGMDWEAKRIASAIYILVHDGKRDTKSVLTQLGTRKSFEYLSTASLVSQQTPLAGVLMAFESGQAFYLPLCIGAERQFWFHDLPFEEWWKEPIFMSASGQTYARWQLVLAFRNKDGGGHYDSIIDDPIYVELRAFKGGGALPGLLNDIRQNPNARKHIPNGHFPVAGGHQAIIRQIAWELDFSLHRAGLIGGKPQYCAR